MHTGSECGILDITFRGAHCPVCADSHVVQEDRLMSKTEKFFRALAWFCLGAIVGFLLAPIKKGVDISICSNNVGADGFTFFDDDDEDELDEMDD